MEQEKKNEKRQYESETTSSTKENKMICDLRCHGTEARGSLGMTTRYLTPCRGALDVDGYELVTMLVSLQIAIGIRKTVRWT